MSEAEKGVLIRRFRSYDAYDERIPFCRPASLHPQPLSLGSAVMGDRLYNSDFDLHMRRNETCKTLCTTTISPNQTDFLQSLIRDYAHNWVVDGLPAAEMRADGAGRTLYSSGFPVGGYRTVLTPEAPEAAPRETFELYNHFQIVIEYHPRPKEGASRIVGVLVWPQSIDSLKGSRLSSPDCDATGTFAVAAGDRAKNVAYTYDVYWRVRTEDLPTQLPLTALAQESATPWATRWDSYLRIVEPRIHVLALINSIVICLFRKSRVSSRSVGSVLTSPSQSA